jgi:hypothetical protein
VTTSKTLSLITLQDFSGDICIDQVPMQLPILSESMVARMGEGFKLTNQTVFNRYQYHVMRRCNKPVTAERPYRRILPNTARSFPATELRPLHHIQSTYHKAL